LKEERLFKESFFRKLLFFVTAFTLLFSIRFAAGSEAAGQQLNENPKQIVMHQVAQSWIQVGIAQFKKGLFEASERSFHMASEYQEYLSVAERRSLGEFFEKLWLAKLERKKQLRHIKTADEFINQGKTIEAMAHLKKVKSNKFLSMQDSMVVTKRLEKVSEQLERQKNRDAQLYQQSVKYYHAGRLTEARDGFIALAGSGFLEAPKGQRPEDYLKLIDSVIGLKVKVASKKPKIVTKDISGRSGDVEEKLVGMLDHNGGKSEPRRGPETNLSTIVDIAEPVTDRSKGTSSNEATNSQYYIKQNYARAVVKDAVVKVENCVNEGRFFIGFRQVESAKVTIEQNRGYLGVGLYSLYQRKLGQLSSEIAKGRARWLGSLKELESAK